MPSRPVSTRLDVLADSLKPATTASSPSSTPPVLKEGPAPPKKTGIKRKSKRSLVASSET
ncbi:hypothetical protein E4U53_004956, partial [Claviceps sorghi]